METDDTWSPWTPLALNMPAETLGELLDGGQSFRWRSDSRGIWHGCWGGFAARLRSGEGDRGGEGGRSDDGANGSERGRCRTVSFSAPLSLGPHAAPALARLLALETDFAALTDALPWRTDAHLARCIAAYPGLRILRLPFGETLLGFICSATKRIVQIKEMMALLAERHGQPITADDTGSRTSSGALRRLPTWAEIAEIPEAELRRCKLGFRARHVHAVARRLAAEPDWLEETEAMPYATAKARLIGLPGVGEKIADCVLLFGAGRLEAFPVDVWILKALEKHYGLDGWRPAQVAHFGRTHFGPLAGLAQQLLFAYERGAAAKRPPSPEGFRARGATATGTHS